MGSNDEPEKHLRDGVSLVRAPGLTLIMDTPKGRGVFAHQFIPAKTVLEVSPVLILDPNENDEHVCKTDLYNYTYNWPYQGGETCSSAPSTTQAVVFGLGSLFNHSRSAQNVGWMRDVPNKLVIYRALRDIRQGEELCISYGDRLTFKDVDDHVDDSGEEEEWGLARIELV